MVGSLTPELRDLVDAEIASRGGGGAPPVTCTLLRTDTLDVSGAGRHPILWTGLEDNVWDENPLAAIPDGLGMAFLFDNSAATLTTTEPGTWALSISIVGGADPAWEGQYNDDLWSQSTIAQAASNASVTVAAVYTLPAGAQISPGIVTVTPAESSMAFGLFTAILTRLA